MAVTEVGSSLRFSRVAVVRSMQFSMVHIVSIATCNSIEAIASSWKESGEVWLAKAMKNGLNSKAGGCAEGPVAWWPSSDSQSDV